MSDVHKDLVLNDIEVRCAQASPGPWISIVEGRDQQGGSSFILTGAPESADIELIGATADEQDFIANSRLDVPRLVAEIKRLRSLVSAKSRAEGIVTDGGLDLEIRGIEHRVARVPPGPWASLGGEEHLVGRHFIKLGPTNMGGEIEVLGATAADLDFIVHARQDIPRLVAEIRTLRSLAFHGLK